MMIDFLGANDHPRGEPKLLKIASHLSLSSWHRVKKKRRKRVSYPKLYLLSQKEPGKKIELDFSY